QRKKINTHDIHEVPVEAHDFHGVVVLRGEAGTKRNLDEPDEEAGADNHVQGMQAGHGEIERKIKLSVGIDIGVVLRILGRSGFFQFLSFGGNFLGVIGRQGMPGVIPNIEIAAGDEMVVEFLLVFDDLDAEEDAAESKRGNQKTGDQRFLADLRGPNGHGHGQAAQDEHGGVDGAEFDVQGVAAYAESGEVFVAVYGVGQEHAAEEQNFGDQKDPHAQGGGFLLLLQGLKLPV